MPAQPQHPDLVLVLDSQNQEHYVNLTHVVEVLYSHHPEGQVRAEVVTVVPTSTGSDRHTAPHKIIALGEAALDLRRHLRRRAGLPIDAKLPESEAVQQDSPPARQTPAPLRGY